MGVYLSEADEGDDGGEEHGEGGDDEDAVEDSVSLRHPRPRHLLQLQITSFPLQPILGKDAEEGDEVRIVEIIDIQNPRHVFLNNMMFQPAYDVINHDESNNVVVCNHF